MSDTYTPQVHAETAVCELRKAWLEVLANWPMVARDDNLMDDLRAILGGLQMKVAPNQKRSAA